LNYTKINDVFVLGGGY